MIRIAITTSGIATIGKNGFREIGRRAIVAAATYWRDNYLSLHFQNIAYRRYGYANRSKQYERGKARGKKSADGVPAIGDIKPLVFTGRSREAVDPAYGGSCRITGIAKSFDKYRAEVVINASAFNYGAGQRIDMRDEVTRYTPQEEKTMERVYAVEWDKEARARGLSAPKRTRRTAA